MFSGRRTVWRTVWIHNTRRTLTDHACKQTLKNVVEEKKAQAARSIIVQVASEKSFDNVNHHCSQFGNINNAFYYTVPKDQNLILLEFDSLNAANEAINSSAFPGNGAIPTKSRFLWFRNSKKRETLKQIDHKVKLNTPNAISQPSNQQLVKALKDASSISNQMELLYEKTKLNELSSRLRFLGVQQIEEAFRGFFLNAVVWPFGSTINGFGKLESDLDMILQYNKDSDCVNEFPNTNVDRRLMFHVKGFQPESESDAKKRETLQRHIKVIGSICENFLTGIWDINAIYGARVPIVRYSHKYLNLSADISLLNMSGFYVSELFYMLGEIDKRVRPLLFTVQRWAKEIQTHRKRPGSLTNFHVACFVISFLQQLPEPILPTTNQLISKSRKIDVRHTTNNENYTFLRDLNDFDFQSRNTSSLEELFMQFLEFYGKFDFKKHLISLSSTEAIPKIESCGLQIMNPFVVDQNWGRNVSVEECREIRIEAQQALVDLMEETENSMDKANRWGLLAIFQHIK